MLNLESDFSAFFDPDLIKQALTNIIDNAIKYGLDGYPIIVTALKKDSDMFEIIVKNECENVNEIDTEKIFNRNFRSDLSATKNIRGMGLGLNVAKSIINLHDGLIKAEKTNNSIEFIIQLPLI